MSKNADEASLDHRRLEYLLATAKKLKESQSELSRHLMYQQKEAMNFSQSTQITLPNKLLRTVCIGCGSEFHPEEPGQNCTVTTWRRHFLQQALKTKKEKRSQKKSKDERWVRTSWWVRFGSEKERKEKTSGYYVKVYKCTICGTKTIQDADTFNPPSRPKAEPAQTKNSTLSTQASTDKKTPAVAHGNKGLQRFLQQKAKSNKAGDPKTTGSSSSLSSFLMDLQPK